MKKDTCLGRLKFRLLLCLCIITFGLIGCGNSSSSQDNTTPSKSQIEEDLVQILAENGYYNAEITDYEISKSYTDDNSYSLTVNGSAKTSEETFNFRTEYEYMKYDQGWERITILNPTPLWTTSHTSTSSSGTADNNIKAADNNTDSNNSNQNTHPVIKTLQINYDCNYQGNNPSNSEDYSETYHYDENGYLQSIDYHSASNDFTYYYDWKMDSNNIPTEISITNYNDSTVEVEFQIRQENGCYICTVEGNAVRNTLVNKMFSNEHPRDMRNVSFEVKWDMAQGGYYLFKWNLNLNSYSYTYQICNSDGSSDTVMEYSTNTAGNITYTDLSYSGEGVFTDYEYDGFRPTAYAKDGVMQTIEYNLVDLNGQKCWYLSEGNTETYYSDDTGLRTERITYNSTSDIQNDYFYNYY